LSSGALAIFPCLVSRRTDASVAAALFGVVVALDLLWSQFVGSTGHLAYALVDEPAHLATCTVALLALAALGPASPQRRFAAAALLASMAIDLDHIPGYLGSHLLSGGLPRPYGHSALLVIAIAGAGWASRRRDVREVSLGIAFGVATHLFRDLATGPGVPLFWPVSSDVVTFPYAVFACGLGFAALACAAPGVFASARGRLVRVGVITAVLAVAMLAGAHSAGAAARVGLGAYVPGSQEDPALIDSYAAEVGQSPVIIANYEDWAHPLVDRSWLETIWNRGSVPLITWEPWNWAAPEQGLPLRAIASGRYDAYITSSASEAAAFGKPILLRFAHEMNGGWYPWGGNTAALYVRAWRHVVGIFRGLGASNVSWVWSPYVSNRGRMPFERFYPGDRWVDWVGLDGYNWGSGGTWQSFGRIFGSSYRTLSRMTDKPMMIPETGSTEEGGNKAAWILNALHRALPQFPKIRALVWFSERFHTVEARVDSSESALAALRSAMSSPLFQASRDFLLSMSRFR
jgi:membrane-bound metal-dependent hydrolase YbcI (DUF457 family)